ncbi:hypothetical protein VT84_19530 [Gemmata sp. SH-PL17]|uniref:hypothetical protein n=1 Tax=Gemmata sp. SH-PL17 TaxID=1630693 RepID=UPI00078E698D|nr:hypothetical protein [Gemmata sp. SH-PL17]AMV26599.1 hypothetical protein VT84_19530 [Gemmata sp. SH-PL17]
MRRIVVALAVLVLLCLPGRVSAQEPLGFQIVDAKVEKGKLTWSEEKAVPVARVVEVTVNINGKNVIEKRTVLEYTTSTVTQAHELKNLNATDVKGKAIGADKLAELLKEPTPVVLLIGPLADKHRALFKDKTVFVFLPLPYAVPEPPPADPE